MKYAIFGDLHGTDLKELERALDDINPDVLICLGNFDQTKTIHQFIELERKYLARGKQVIKVPGNHDHALLTGLAITSGTFDVQGKSFRQLYEELQKDNVAKSYLNSLVNSKDPRFTTHRVRFFLDEKKFGNIYQTLIVHGGYAGNLSSFLGCPESIADLWFRLESKQDYELNFDIMKSKGYKIMIRGHDHYPIYVYKDLKKGINGYKEKSGDAFRLFPERMHIINPGALFDSYFAVIDTQAVDEEVPLLRYFNCKSM